MRTTMAYSLEDLRAEIAACPSGRAVGLSYDVYAELFPPGEPDEFARGRAWQFAKDNGCAINNRVTEQTVLFVKPK
jgi:hypothetical protein